MTYTYNTVGTCARQIYIDINDDETINDVQFVGGCNGNLQGISALAKGRSIDEIIDTLKGIDCNFKGTSCPDQLARALEQFKDEVL